jgi:predicted ribonuclease YlaK
MEPKNIIFKKKTFVLDTTVLIYDPDVIFKDGTVDFVIPMVVIKELDGLKNSDNDTVAKAARQVSRTLDRISSYADLAEGARLATGSTLTVYADYEVVDDLASDADNKILGAAIKLKKKVPNLSLYTTDSNMRVTARLHGIKAEIYPFFPGGSDRVQPPIDSNSHMEKEVKHMDKKKKEKAPRKREFRDLAEEELYNDMLLAGLDPDEKVSFFDMLSDVAGSCKFVPKPDVFDLTPSGRRRNPLDPGGLPFPNYRRRD